LLSERIESLRDAQRERVYELIREPIGGALQPASE
jgi:hypothetical protein